MTISRKTINFWIILFFPFLFFKYYVAYVEDKKYQQLYITPLQNHLGRKFDIDNFIDSNRKPVKLDFTKSEITIIDFWFSDCPPCISEMRQFENLIEGKGRELSIVSISINNFAHWTKTIQSSSVKFSFLSKPISNWRHLAMNSAEDPALGNDLPGDNLKTLLNRFQSQKFPMYFVVDQTGTIIASPFSVTDFIKNKFSNNGKLLSFLSNDRTWSLLYSIIFRAFIEFSGYYWIIILLLLSAIQIFQKKGINQ